MSVKLLTEHHLEFLSLKGDCTGSSESTLVKMPHCWKLHVTAHLFPLTVAAFADSIFFSDLRNHLLCLNLDLVVTKPVFGVSDKVRFKPVSSATETS